jgi:hypothetical protein
VGGTGFFLCATKSKGSILGARPSSGDSLPLTLTTAAAGVMQVDLDEGCISKLEDRDFFLG